MELKKKERKKERKNEWMNEKEKLPKLVALLKVKSRIIKEQ